MLPEPSAFRTLTAGAVTISWQNSTGAAILAFSVRCTPRDGSADFGLTLPACAVMVLCVEALVMTLNGLCLSHRQTGQTLV